jgi:uncharacterized protein (TIGR03083 family)
MGRMTTSTSTAALSRTVVAHGCRDEYAAFASLVESLSASEWSKPSRCEGFEVRDVAGHVIGLAEDVPAGKPGTRNAQEEAASVRGDTPAVAAARLRAALEAIIPLLDGADDAMWATPILGDMTLGEGVLLLWYDAFVHADDIRAATGRPSEHGAGLGASVAYLAAELTKREFAPSTLALTGMARYDVNGGGPAITGDALSFVLAATGRADATALRLDPSVNIYA